MKHIMMLFLSEVHLNPDRTLSFSRYKNPDGTMIYCVQTNESAVRRTADLLQKQGERLDCLFYFSTKQTQEEISYIDEVGDERTMTHEALFRERVQSFAAHCIRIDYDERSQTEESIRRALEMANTIRTFIEAQSWQPEDVELHVDVTGGFRHASMMLLSVMQLLKYGGIRTTSVRYSNRHEQQVENVTDIYRMFNLISGADEFINFGSTCEIMAYMEGAKQTAETKMLLQTMGDFTDAVRICRTGDIALLAKELQEALKNFEQAGAVSLQEKIFLRILEVFKSEYGSLLKEDFTNFDIIRWCVEKGCLQQAMTLCSEWIPGEIVGRHIFYPVKDSIIAECNRQKANYQTWQQYFLNDLTVGQGEEKEASKEDHEAPQKEERSEQTDRERREQRKHTMVRVFECTGKFSSVSKFFSDEAEPFKPLLEELNACHRALYDLKRDLLTLGQLKEKLPRIYTTLWAMYRQAAEDPDFTRTAEDYFKTREMGDVYEFLKMAPYELFQILLQSPEGGEDDLPSEGISAAETVKTTPSSTADETLGDDVISADHENSEDDVISEKYRLDEALEKGVLPGSNEPSEGYIFGIYCEDDNWNNRQANYLRLMNHGEAGYVRPVRATLEILYNYWQIRIERNNINHANDQGSLSIEAMKDLILDLLRRMKNIAERE
ncbi:TM1812 family CRISPR-associated protein [uncultured Megasphaera sp.]|uniref:TM1812 family CRISPR-associated protein n=1 Tax=uncultured Megasphaera sp. TaxID=165188 RepID=UPI0025E4BCEE|nr:TM1812 family CRISPR-associated protein [uncultured Megasphaera sp.]